MEYSRLLGKKSFRVLPKANSAGLLSRTLHGVVVVVTHATTVPLVNKKQWTTSGKSGGKLVEKDGKLWDIPIHIVFSPPSCNTRVTSVNSTSSSRTPELPNSNFLSSSQTPVCAPSSSKTILKLNLTSQLYIFRAFISSISSERSSRRLIH